MRIVIVGSGAAGATAAQFARKTNRTADIVVVSRESHGEYSKCGLPYVLSGVIDDFNSLVEYPPEWFKRFGVQLRLATHVTSVDAKQRTITTATPLGSDMQVMEYDTLILATGARPRIPHLPGAIRSDGTLEDHVHVLRTIEDGQSLAAALDRASTCAIIGAGLIGMELAEALASHRSDRFEMPLVLDVQPHVLPGMIDADMAKPVEAAAVTHGVRFVPSISVDNIEHHRDECRINCRSLDDGEQSVHNAEMILLCTGNTPSVALGSVAGCEIGTSGGIVVDSRCRTSTPGVYAAGDCTEYEDFVTGRRVSVAMGSIAARQGRVAGINAGGGDEYLAPGLLNSRTTRLFGLEVAATGPTYTDLRESGIEPLTGRITASTLPEYYPGGKAITVKLLTHPEDCRILGAQVVGEEGAHLRINLLSAAVMNVVTVERLLQLETCYAPPLAPTFDCVTLAAEAVRAKWRRQVGSRE